MIVCAAVVGPANNPLFLASNLRGAQAAAGYHDAPDEDPIRFHYIVHCALDVVDERLGGGAPAGETSKGDAYLGMLYPTEDFRVYGWVPLLPSVEAMPRT
jgi:hypothetical protein